MCGMLLAATGAVLGSAGICGFARFERDAVRRREHACCRDVRREGGLGRRRRARELSPCPPRVSIVLRAHSFPLPSSFRSVKGTPPWAEALGYITNVPDIHQVVPSAIRAVIEAEAVPDFMGDGVHPAHRELGEHGV